MIEEQITPCPGCGAIAGWWSPIKLDFSMVFHAPNGEITERRIEECQRKYCADCDSNVTKCVREVLGT